MADDDTTDTDRHHLDAQEAADLAEQVCQALKARLKPIQAEREAGGDCACCVSRATAYGLLIMASTAGTFAHQGDLRLAKKDFLHFFTETLVTDAKTFKAFLRETGAVTNKANPSRGGH